MMTSRLLLVSAMALLCAVCMTTSCEAPPNEERSFTKVDYYHLSQGMSELKAPLIELINGAELSIDIALSRLEDDEVSAALIAAQARGVRVRVVTDTQFMEDRGFVALTAAGVPVVSGDGVVRYLPDPTLTSVLEACVDLPGFRECTARGIPVERADDGVIVRPDHYNLMSSNFAVVDEFDIWVSATPLIDGVTLGVGWTSYSQDIGMAFTREFQQMAGGVFATTLDLFNGPVKSTVHGMLYDSRIPDAKPGRYLQLQPGYVTNKGIVNIMFNPQQRLVKEIIDELYRSRASIFLMTDELRHDFAIDALLYKVNAGFEVRIIVREGSFIPQELRDTGVVRTLPAEYLPTILITDHLEDRNDDVWPRSAMTMSHQMFRSAPFEVIRPEPGSGLSNDLVRIYPSDFFADGTLWHMREFVGMRNNELEESEVERLTIRWLSSWANATPIQ